MAENDLSLFRALQTVIEAARDQAENLRRDGLTGMADEIDDAILALSRRLGELSRQALDAVRQG